MSEKPAMTDRQVFLELPGQWLIRAFRMPREKFAVSLGSAYLAI
jgi:hypothetical protein